MTTLRERFDLVMRERGWTKNQWCERSGLDRGTLRQAYRRHADDEDISLRVDVLVKLAKSANVSVEWLAAGTGEIFADPRPAPDPLYPSRSKAIAAARLWFYDADVIARVAAIDDLPSDPGPDYWRARLDAEQALARAQGNRTK